MTSDKSKRRKNKQKKSSRGKRRRSAAGLLHMRAKSIKTVDVDRLTPIKMAGLVHRVRIRDANFNSPVFEARLARQFNTIPGNRPIERVTKFSLTGSPEQIMTPGKTLLDRSSKNGVFYIFSNIVQPEEKPIIQTVDDTFKSSSSYQAIQAASESIKTQVITLTPAMLQQQAQRSSQNQTMVKSGVSKLLGGSTAYARSADLISEGQYAEWLHLVAHSFIGKKGQVPNNLVSGTDHANTDMIFVETLVRDFSTVYPQGFQLEVTANLIEGTHLATTIDYKITTKDFSLDFSFNAQSSIQPHVLYQEYISAFGKVLTNKDSDNVEMAAVTSSSNHSVFFKKITEINALDRPASPTEDKMTDALEQVFEQLIGRPKK